MLEVRFDDRRDDASLSEVLRREGAGTQLIACRLSDRAPRRLLRWLDVDVPSERRDRLLRLLRRRVPARDLAVAVIGPDRLLVRVTERAPAICLAAFRAGGLCVNCPLLAVRVRPPVRMVVPRGTDLSRFLRDVRGGGARLSIARPKPYRSGAGLTRRQDRALRTAYGLGYFDYPRRGTLGDVARALGVGRSAALEMLRRAMAKLAEGRYADELRPRGAL